MTILASFSLPSLLANKISKTYDISPSTAFNLAQVITPVSMQILSTPLHLYGLDLYNHENASKQDRIKFVQTEYLKTTLARMSRILPAYGFGGVINKYLRIASHDNLYYYYG